MPIAFMAEKIVNSHAFLSNLSSLAEVYPIALSAVDMIKEYEHEALPSIHATSSKKTSVKQRSQSVIAKTKSMSGKNLSRSLKNS